MSRLVVAGISLSALFFAGLVVAQTEPAAEGAGVAMVQYEARHHRHRAHRLESNEGKKLFENLKAENDKVMAERTKLEQEIREMQAKANSGDPLSRWP